MSVATVKTAAAAKIASDFTITRLAKDHDDEEPIASGATRFQLRAAPTGYVGHSNTRKQAVGFDVLVKRRLAASADERAWVEGGLQTILAGLTDPEWWRAVAGVYDFLSNASNVGTTIEVEDLLVTATVKVALAIDL